MTGALVTPAADLAALAKRKLATQSVEAEQDPTEREARG
jgi:hypothetical protein